MTGPRARRASSPGALGALLLALSWFAAACGSGAQAAEPSARDLEPEAPSGERASEAEPAEPRSAEQKEAVTRAEVDEALDRGPAVWLQKLEVQPHFEDGAFAGWEILELEDPAPFEAAGLERGDVVTTVNDHELERPEYLHAVFLELRTASAIVVRGERSEGEPFEIEVPIVGGGESPGQAAEGEEGEADRGGGRDDRPPPRSGDGGDGGERRDGGDRGPDP